VMSFTLVTTTKDLIRHGLGHSNDKINYKISEILYSAGGLVR
jgi:hypothetical protein